MKLKPEITVLISVLFVVAGIAVTMATGLWQTESDKIPKKLETVTQTDDGQTVQYDPADIRGSYTFKEISDLFGVPFEDLKAAFALPEDGADSFQVKSLETLLPDTGVEIGTSSVRMFVAYYLGIDYTPTEENYLTEAAAVILKEKGKMTPEQTSYVEAHTVAVE